LCALEGSRRLLYIYFEVYSWTEFILAYHIFADSSSAIDGQKLDIKVKCGTSRNDTSGSTITVAKIWRDDELARLADAHAQDSLVPTTNDLKKS
jgi:hypothetical protein